MQNFEVTVIKGFRLSRRQKLNKFSNTPKFSYYILAKTWCHWGKWESRHPSDKHVSWNCLEYKNTLNVPNWCNIWHAHNTYTNQAWPNHLIQSLVMANCWMSHVAGWLLYGDSRTERLWVLTINVWLMYIKGCLRQAWAALIKTCNRTNFREQQSRLEFNRISIKQESKSREKMLPQQDRLESEKRVAFEMGSWVGK